MQIMRYEKTVQATFLERPNRFVAQVRLESGAVVSAHVKNTGRCQELLLPGVMVILTDHRANMGSRKLAYSLIAVYKETSGTRRLINMDSQAPNAVMAEALAGGALALPDLGTLAEIQREKTRGDSRYDFRVVDQEGREGWLEVKGVTLEVDNFCRFPDAPTERGVRHLQGLEAAARDGVWAGVLFLVQMEGVSGMGPNEETHPAFGAALRDAARAGVHVIARECHVEEGTLTMGKEIPVIL